MAPASSTTIRAMPDHDAEQRTGVLPPAVRSFLRERHYAVLAALDEDGGPRQAVVWYRLDDDGTLLVNSREGRRWPSNLRRDARLSIAVMDEASPVRWVGATGSVEAIVDDQAVAQADIAALARRYDPPEEADPEIRTFRTQRRVSFRLRLREIHDSL
jgi:PPOX class probable F420-dependent enzyme